MREGLTGDASANKQDGYSPVINWATIRMMLTVSVKYGLHATQVDFNNAFVQAPLKEPMFMSLPPVSQCIQHPVPVLHSRLYYSLTITVTQDQTCSNQEQ
jgi:hypothetical protein